MTRDEVMALSDEELDAKAKELTGRAQREQCGSLLGKPMFIQWSPSTDIAAAWELVEALREAWGLVIATPHSITETDETRGKYCIQYDSSDARIFDEFAPRAITRAFVLAMTNND